MYAVRSLDLPRRRTMLVLLGVASALLLATALMLERLSIAASTSGGTDGGVANGGGVAALVDPAAPQPADRDASTPAIAPGEEGAGDAPDATIGVDAEAAKSDAFTTTDTIAPPELDARIIRSGSIEAPSIAS